jgi:hypothetical protein
MGTHTHTDMKELFDASHMCLEITLALFPFVGHFVTHGVTARPCQVRLDMLTLTCADALDTHTLIDLLNSRRQSAMTLLKLHTKLWWRWRW